GCPSAIGLRGACHRGQNTFSIKHLASMYDIGRAGWLGLPCRTPAFTGGLRHAWVWRGFGRPPVNYRWQGIASWVARPKPRSRSACFKKKCLTPASALTARREECIEQWSRKGTRNRLVWPRSAGDGSCPKGSEQVIIMVLITISLRQCRAKHRAPPICSPF